MAFYSVPVSGDEPYEGPWVSEASGEEVIKCFEDWEPEVVELLKASLIFVVYLYKISLVVFHGQN